MPTPTWSASWPGSGRGCEQTLPTWQHVQAVYRQHAAQVEARYGRRLAPGIAHRIDRQVAQVAAAIERCGSYPALSATAPSTPVSP